MKALKNKILVKTEDCSLVRFSEWQQAKPTNTHPAFKEEA